MKNPTTHVLTTIPVSAQTLCDELAHGIRRALDPVLFLSGERNLDQVGERRVTEGAAPLELSVEESLRVVPGSVADARRAGG